MKLEVKRSVPFPPPIPLEYSSQCHRIICDEIFVLWLKWWVDNHLIHLSVQRPEQIRTNKELCVGTMGPCPDKRISDKGPAQGFWGTKAEFCAAFHTITTNLRNFLIMMQQQNPDIRVGKQNFSGPKMYEYSFCKKLSKMSPSLSKNNRFSENRKIFSSVRLHRWMCFWKFISMYCKTLFMTPLPKPRHKSEKRFSRFRYHPASPFANNLDPIGLEFAFIWRFEVG